MKIPKRAIIFGVIIFILSNVIFYMMHGIFGLLIPISILCILGIMIIFDKELDIFINWLNKK